MNSPHSEPIHPAPSDDSRLLPLLDALANETLTDGQHDELQNLLRDNPQAQQTYFNFIDLELGLRQIIAAEPHAGCHLGEEGPVTVASRGDSDRSRRWQLPMIAALTAALAVIAVLAVSPNGRFRSEPVVAEAKNPSPKNLSQDRTRTAAGSVSGPSAVAEAGPELIQSAGAELFGERVPAVGETFSLNHEYALTAGLLELGFANGARVILEAPSVVQITASDRMTVRLGVCSVHAPPGAEGFRVDTPHTEIVDLGTRFSVKVNDVGETDVLVVEGAAEVRAAESAAEPLLLTSQQARRFGGGNRNGGSQSLDFTSDCYRRDLPDRIVDYTARASADGYIDELQNVTVQRGGKIATYSVSSLIGIDVTHFRAGPNVHNLVIPSPSDRADSEPQPFSDPAERRGTLEADALLQTGIINPGGSEQPLTENPRLGVSGASDELTTPGMAIHFRQPVVNGPGPDLLFFELQSVIDPPEGDAFHISPIEFRPGLRTHTVKRFDISMASRQARPLVMFDQFVYATPPHSLTELLTDSARIRTATLRFHAIAVGIDLSDLGFAPGETVSDLFIQDTLDDSHLVDPVFIAGLPTADEEIAQP